MAGSASGSVPLRLMLNCHTHVRVCRPKKAGPKGGPPFFGLAKELVWADRPELILQGGQTRVDMQGSNTDFTYVKPTLAGVDFTWQL